MACTTISRDDLADAVTKLDAAQKKADAYFEDDEFDVDAATEHLDDILWLAACTVLLGARGFVRVRALELVVEHADFFLEGRRREFNPLELAESVARRVRTR